MLGISVNHAVADYIHSTQDSKLAMEQLNFQVNSPRMCNVNTLSYNALYYSDHTFGSSKVVNGVAWRKHFVSAAVVGEGRGRHIASSAA